jgi:hypothetical protein
MIQIIGDQRVGAHILLLFLGSKGTSESYKSLDVSRYLPSSSWIVSAAIKLYIICYFLTFFVKATSVFLTDIAADFKVFPDFFCLNLIRETRDL